MQLNSLRLILGVLLLGWCTPVMGATSYVVGEGSEISFVAKITGSSFRGKSKSLEGKVELNETGDTLVGAFIKVKASGFKTGMSQRDNHMRRKYIEASRFPWVSFKVEEPTGVLYDGTPMDLVGTISFHGVEKKSTAKVRVINRSEEGLVIKADFELNILDYGIKQPKFTVVKMAPLLKFEVTLALRKQ